LHNYLQVIFYCLDLVIYELPEYSLGMIKRGFSSFFGWRLTGTDGAHTKRRKTKRRISKRRYYKTSNHKRLTLQKCPISYNSILFHRVKWAFNQT
jgi:ribosomal protein L32